MQNVLALIELGLQGLTQMQTYQVAVQKAISEGRDLTKEEVDAARNALTDHLGELQRLIDSMK